VCECGPVPRPPARDARDPPPPRPAPLPLEFRPIRSPLFRRPPLRLRRSSSNSCLVRGRSVFRCRNSATSATPHMSLADSLFFRRSTATREYICVVSLTAERSISHKTLLL
jgi:hypothetical protein